MATGSMSLESLRGAIDATEGAATTPTRLLYIPQGAFAVMDKNEPIVIELAWNKQDSVSDILAGLNDVTVTVTNAPVSYEDAAFWWAGLCGALGETPATVDTSAYLRTGNPSQTDTTVSATGVRALHLQWAPSDFISTRGLSIPGLIMEDFSLTIKKRASGADPGCTW